MAGRNPAWSRDELIVALDQYVRLDFAMNLSKLSKLSPDIVQTSVALNELPIHLLRPDAERFRNPNGVYMKLCNFLRFDSEYAGVGLTSGGKLEAQIWKEFASDPQRLHSVAQAILATRKVSETSLATTYDAGEEAEVIEGTILLRQHQARERDRSLVRRKKEIALREAGSLPCEVCEF